MDFFVFLIVGIHWRSNGVAGNRGNTPDFIDDTRCSTRWHGVDWMQDTATKIIKFGWGGCHGIVWFERSEKVGN